MLSPWLVARGDAGAHYGVVVRDRSTQLHCDGCLRATVGTPEENAAFLALLEKTAARFFPKPLKAPSPTIATAGHVDKLAALRGVALACALGRFAGVR